MTIPKLNLPLQLTHGVVREFDVFVNVNNDGDSKSTGTTAGESEGGYVTIPIRRWYVNRSGT